MEPVFGQVQHGSTPNLQVSFLELIEIAVAAHWRKLGIKLDRIRAAHAFARTKLYEPFPFATMDFKTRGGHLVHEFEVELPERGARHRGMMAFDTAGQWALPLEIREELEAVDYADDHLAARWYPFGRRAQIVVDPHFAAGRPIIKGTRISIRDLKQRWDAGESFDALARDYDLQTSVVEDAIRLASAAA
jgi:uncharacterized protein (DUF433 family)